MILNEHYGVYKVSFNLSIQIINLEFTDYSQYR